MMKRPMDEKAICINKLEAAGSIYFEKTLTPSSVYSSDYLYGRGSTPSTLALPIWLVQNHWHMLQNTSITLQNLEEHKDKLQNVRVTLQYELYEITWPVKLSFYSQKIDHDTTGKIFRQVKLAGGWRDFATFHELFVGDSVIFILQGFADFLVLVFASGTGNMPKKLQASKSTRKARKKRQSNYDASELSTQKRANLQANVCEDEVQEMPLVAAESHSSMQSLQTREEANPNTLALTVTVSANSRKEEGEERRMEIERERVRMDQEAEEERQIMEKKREEDVRVNLEAEEERRMEKEGERQRLYQEAEEEKQIEKERERLRIIQEEEENRTQLRIRENLEEDKDDVPEKEYQELPLIKKISTMFPLGAGFIKQLTRRHFLHREGPAEWGERTACMEIPVVFWQTYGSQIKSPVKLQGVRENSQVQVVDCYPILQADQTWRLFLKTGWREFVEANNLQVGQLLEFSLKADSYFIVRSV